MKQEGKCIIGNPIVLDSFTSDWLHVRLHPTTFYRRKHEFEEWFKDVKGFYVELDMGDFVDIRFSEKEDLTAFHRKHHEYI